MIIKSRVTGKHVLSIFENFTVDRTLPKNKKEQTESNYNNMNIGFSSSDDVEMSQWSSPAFFDNVGVKNSSGGVSFWNRGWRASILSSVEKILGMRKKPEPTSGNHDPMKILLSVRGSLKEAKDYTGRLTHYDDAIKQAVKAGQKARMEKLVSARDIVKHESLLLATGFKQYMSEDTAIDFALKCQKGLRLDWITNFARPIPAEVIERKVEADGLKIFDNYVVLHYDPREQAFALTKAQEEAKKDPILFGVVKDVRKLYFIGDWMDDECSLTMAEVATVLGRETEQINEDPSVEA
jgi:hypothetical protein